MKRMAILCTAGLAACLVGCSMNLSTANLEGIPLGAEGDSFWGKIQITMGENTHELDRELLMAYTAAAGAEAFPRERCRGFAAVRASVRQDGERDARALGTAFIPFWPALPVKETWTYQLSASIYCDDILVKNMVFSEEEHIDAFWYGRLRSDLANGISRDMHRKLVQRLRFELSNHEADLNSARDYSVIY